MRILAIETSTREGSVALYQGDHLLGYEPLASQSRTTSALLPAIHSLLEQFKWLPSEIELVATTVGPGSFTGLRVGVTTAKSLAYAASAKVMGLHTLEVIAHQATEALADGPIEAVLDAQRGELFVARFDRQNQHELCSSGATSIVPNDQWIASLSPGTTVCGPPLAKIQEQLPEGVIVAQPEAWTPRATTVGNIAWQRHQHAQTDDLWQLAPQYYRQSAAEEKWAEKHASE